MPFHMTMNEPNAWVVGAETPYGVAATGDHDYIPTYRRFGIACELAGVGIGFTGDELGGMAVYI